MRKFIHYWRFEDGTISPRGWHCWVYTGIMPPEFNDWLATVRGRYSASMRFNGGNPVYHMHIEDEEVAMLLRLHWGEYIEKQL